MTVAEIRVTNRPGAVLVASECRVDGAVVHVTGRWRRRTGPNHEQLRYGPEQRYTFPAHRCEIRWTSAVAA